MGHKTKELELAGASAFKRLIERLLETVGDLVVNVDSVADLPAVGNEHTLYVVTGVEGVYRFDKATTTYRNIAQGYNDGDEVVFDANGPVDGDDGN